MTKFVLDENGFVVPYEDWKAGRGETATKTGITASPRKKSEAGISSKKRRKKNHPPKTSKPLTTCPICNVEVREDRLEKHVAKAHSKKIENFPDVKLTGNALSKAPARQQGPDKRRPKKTKICPICSEKIQGRHLPEHLRRHQLQRPKKTRSEWKKVNCPFCGKVIQGELSNHIAKFHLNEPVRPELNRKDIPSTSSTTKKTGSTQNKQGMVTCPVCKASVKQKRLKNYLKKVHPEQAPNKKMVKCRICGVDVLEKNLNKHVKKAHPRQGVDRSNAKSAATVSSTAERKKEKQIKQADPVRTASNVVLYSKRGSKVEDKRRQCNECGVYFNVLWRYSRSNYGPVLLCSRCKPIVFDRSFNKIDAMDLAYTSHFESNPRRH